MPPTLTHALLLASVLWPASSTCADARPATILAGFEQDSADRV
jgi:hypothetical protein